MTKQVNEDLKAVGTTVFAIANAIQQGFERIRPTLEAVALAVDKFRQQYAGVIQQVAETYAPKIAEFTEQVIKWQVAQKMNVAYMAERGWFPNWFTFSVKRGEQHEDVDDFMISHIDACWQELKKGILERSQNRAHILEVAFKLHEDGNYIASIPLFLTQSDGICSEKFTYFFTRNPQTGRKAADEILYQVKSSELAVNFFSEILLEPFKTDLQISQASSKSSKAAKGKGPNRHGIIHGSRKHLDYGTKVNGYKAVSFLAFIVFTTKDIFRKSPNSTPG